MRPSRVTRGADTDQLERLARLEFEMLCRDLVEWPDPVPDDTALPPQTPERPALVIMAELPRLPVPMGRIVVDAGDRRLPVIGIAVSAVPRRQRRVALYRLFAEHRRAPIGRLLFLLSDPGLAPLLGRYGFAYHLGTDPLPVVDRTYLWHRYGMFEIRSLADGATLWSKKDDEKI